MDTFRSRLCSADYVGMFKFSKLLSEAAAARIAALVWTGSQARATEPFPHLLCTEGGPTRMMSRSPAVGGHVVMHTALAFVILLNF